MTIEQLIRTIHESINKANQDHEDWTGGYWLCHYGVEGFLVSRIADGIMDPNNNGKWHGLLTLETSFAELYYGSSFPKGKRSIYSKDNNRIDIALYHKNESLSHVMEVKRFWSPACIDDLLRLCSFYKKYSRRLEKGTLKEAIFIQLVYVCSQKKPNEISKRIDRYFDTLEQKCKTIILKQRLNYQAYKGTDYYPLMLSPDNTEAFSSFCLRLCP